MSWPDDEELPIGVYAAFGADLTAHPSTWVLTDLTSRLEGNPIPIRRGASDGAGEPSAGTCTVLLRNDDGALTPLNPMSTYYPGVDLNTPVLVDVGRISPVTDADAWSTNSTNSLGISDGGRTWQTISAGGTVLTSDYQVAGGVATMSVPVANAYRSGYIAVGAADVDVACTVSAAVTVAGGPIEPGNLMLRIQDTTHYYLFRISVAVGGVITASINANGGFGELVSGVVSGLTWSSGTALRMRAQAWGTWVRMKVWAASGTEPDAWTLATSNDEYLTAGGVGVRSGVANGNSNTKPVIFSHDNFTVTELPSIRMDGFADSWEPTFIPAGDDEFVSGVELTASGILRRLGQGEPDGRSALRRALDDSSPLAYWPMEDGEDSTQAASGLIGGTPMVVASDIMDFVSESPPGALGSAQPDPTASNSLTGPIVGGSATAWQMSVWTKGVENNISSYYVPAEVRTTTGRILRLIMQQSSDVAAIGDYASEASTTPANFQSATFSTFGKAIDGNWHLLAATFTQSGGNVNVSFYYDGVPASSGTWVGVTIGAPISGAAIGRFGGTSGAISDDMEEIYVNHLAVHNGATIVDQYDAGFGYAGEPASDRIARICAKARIPVLIEAGASEPLGPQPASRDVEIIRDAAKADMGLLSEYLWGLRFRPRSTRYNLSASLTVDLATYLHPDRPDSILAPVYDDQSVRNDWTVTRPNGSFGQARDQAHIDRYGAYIDSTEVNVATDGVLDDQAGWRVHLGTWQEMRYPTLPLHFEVNLGLLDDWLALDVGDRVDRINVPPQHPPGPIAQIVNGYSETLKPKAWTVSASCSPYGPWEVAVTDGDQRVPADGSTAAVALAAGGATLSLASTTANGLWIAGDATSRPNDFPLPLRIGGERATASAIGPIASDLFTRTTSSGGWGTATSGHVWTVGNGTAANFSTNGSAGLIALTALNVETAATFDVGSANPQEMQVQCLLNVTPTGAGMNWGVLLRWVDSSNYVWVDTQVNTDSTLTLRMVKRVAGVATLIASAAVGTAHSTSVARILRGRVDGNNLYARVWSASGTDLGGWELVATDTGLPAGTRAGVVTRLMTGNTNVGGASFAFDNLAMLSPQAATLSARGVNGIVRAWPAGTPVDVWAPAIAAL